MQFVGFALLAVGLIIMLVGGIWVLILAFQESILWGLGTLIVPFVGLIFVIMHWDKAGKPFLIQLGGLVIYFAGMFMAGAGLQGN